MAPASLIGAPSGLAVLPNGHALYVADERYASVYAVDPESHGIVAVIPVSGATALAASPDGRAVYVADSFGRRLSVIDPIPNTVVRVIPLSASPGRRLAISLDGRTAYLPNNGDAGHAALVTVDLESGVARAALPFVSPPTAVTLSRDGRTVYAVDQFAQQVFAIDAVSETIVAHWPAGDTPYALTVGARRDLDCAGRCAGDCNGDCRVGIDELVMSVDIVRGDAPIQTCFALESLDIAALIRSVRASLLGCV